MNGSPMSATSIGQLVAVTAAYGLAAVFVMAAVAKLRDRRATARDFASLGLPRPELFAVAVPLVELATAGVLVLLPGWGGVMAAALLVGFTTNLALVIRSGREATCACFGATTAEPVSPRLLIRNAGLVVLALVAATFSGWVWSI